MKSLAKHNTIRLLFFVDVLGYAPVTLLFTLNGYGMFPWQAMVDPGLCLGVFCLFRRPKAAYLFVFFMKSGRVRVAQFIADMLD